MGSMDEVLEIKNEFLDHTHAGGSGGSERLPI
jgi:hypothetical protein